jgi:hypothetical protein
VRKIRRQLSSFELEPKGRPGSEIGERQKAGVIRGQGGQERGVGTGKSGRNDGGRSTGRQDTIRAARDDNGGNGEARVKAKAKAKAARGKQRCN